MDVLSRKWYLGDSSSILLCFLIYFCCSNYYKERESKIVESTLRKPVSTISNFLLLLLRVKNYSLAAS
jgi:hypothetical protein